MDIRTIKIDKGDEKLNHEPFLKIVVNGSGCSIMGCNCSPNNFITISNGEILLTTELTKEEAGEIRKGQFSYNH